MQAGSCWCGTQVNQRSTVDAHLLHMTFNCRTPSCHTFAHALWRMGIWYLSMVGNSTLDCDTYYDDAEVFDEHTCQIWLVLSSSHVTRVLHHTSSLLLPWVLTEACTTAGAMPHDTNPKPSCHWSATLLPTQILLSLKTSFLMTAHSKVCVNEDMHCCRWIACSPSKRAVSCHTATLLR